MRIYDAARTTSADSVAKGIAAAVAARRRRDRHRGSGLLAPAADDDVAKVARAVDDGVRQGRADRRGQPATTAARRPTLPASLPHVLVAGSTTRAGTRSAPTNTGPWLDVLAARRRASRRRCRARVCASGFGFSAGTSFAAPTLGGAAALVQARRPGLTTQQYFELTAPRARPTSAPPAATTTAGSGVLDVAAALRAAPLAKETGPRSTTTPTGSAAPAPGRTPRC